MTKEPAAPGPADSHPAAEDVGRVNPGRSTPEREAARQVSGRGATWNRMPLVAARLIASGTNGEIIDSK